MTVATVPTWAAPPPGAIADAHALTHALVVELHGDERAHTYAGACAAISWVVGMQPSPMTSYDGEPTAEAVRGEMMLADAVAAGQALPDALWASLGVSPRQPVTGHVGWSSGVAASLGWLLGVHARPPVRLPRRLPDGSTPTAEQLTAEYVSSTFGEPEARAAARRRAEADAALYQQLAAIVDSVR